MPARPNHYHLRCFIRASFRFIIKKRLWDGVHHRLR